MILALALLASLGVTEGEISLPPWPLAPDGDQVAVLGGGTLSAEGATVERVGGGVWSVHPEPGRERIHLRAGASVVDVAVGPPPGRILVTADPAEPVKGRDAQVRLRFDAIGVGGEPLALAGPPVVSVSAGKLGTLAPGDAPGRYVATWEPSDSPQPEVLGVVAIAPRCPLCATPLASGVARVPVSAAIDLPGRSEPGVATRVEIGGRAWGPVRTDADGRFSVPVVVPPGARWAIATSMSAAGNERRSRLDLRLSEAPGFHCLAWPRRVPADGRTDVGLRCVAWSASGGPHDPSPLKGAAGRGRLRATRVEGEEWTSLYQPPLGGAGPESIAVSWGPLPSVRSEVPVRLTAGSPATISWEVEGEPAVPGARLRASARALDLHGDPIGDAVSADDSLVDGTVRVRPGFGDGLQRLRLRFALAPGGSADRLSVHRDGAEWVAVARDVEARPVPGVEVRFGDGARSVTDARGETRTADRVAVQTATGPGGLRAIGWADSPLPLPRFELDREVGVSLRPAGAVDVVARLEGRWVQWRVISPEGGALLGRAVSVVSASVDLGPVEAAAGGGRCAVRGGTGTVAITDEESGATALVEVR